MSIISFPITEFTVADIFISMVSPAIYIPGIVPVTLYRPCSMLATTNENPASRVEFLNASAVGNTSALVAAPVSKR